MGERRAQRWKRRLCALVAAAIAAGAVVPHGASATSPAATRPAIPQAARAAAQAEDPAVATGRFHGLTPARLLDTRDGGPLVAGVPIGVDVVGRAGVPSSGVAAVVLNVTATRPSEPSYLTVFPSGEQPPLASNLNFTTGETVANDVIAKLGADGRVSIVLGHGTADVVVDVQGWFGDAVPGSPGALHHGVAPSRVLDTRDAGQPVVGGTWIDLPLAGVGGVPATGAEAVVLNVTATDPSEPSFLTVFPTGEQAPLASNVNFATGTTIANSVIAKLSPDGSVSILLGHGTADVVVDVQGWFGASDEGSGHHPLSPSRLLDTRQPGAAVNGDTSIDLQVAGRGGVPAAGAASAVLNVTVTEPTQPSFLTVYPAGTPRPLASNLNFAGGDTAANLVIAKLGSAGGVSLYLGHGAAHVVVDVLGWFGPSAGTGGWDPASLLPPVPAEQIAAGAGWRFVPAQVLLAPGASRVVELVASAADGTPITAGLPVGTQVRSATPGVAVEYLGNRQVRVTAGGAITSSLAMATIPGFAVGPTLGVTVAELQPGVVPIDDADVVFPPPNLPLNGSVAAIAPEGIAATGAGPFAWSEIVARLKVPDGAELEGLSEAAVLGLDLWYPLVMQGTPPAPGTVIVGSGGSAITGVVVEPPGLPSLTAGGMSLVTVRLAALTEVYRQLDYVVTYDDMVAAGAAPAALGGVDPSETALATARSVRTYAAQMQATDPSAPTTPDPAPPATPDPNAPTQPPAAPTEPVTAAAGGPGGPVNGGLMSKLRECYDSLQGNLAGQLLSFGPLLSMSIRPVLDFRVRIVDSSLIALRLEVGGTLAASLNVVATVQPTVSVSVECELAKLSEFTLVPPGPLAAFVTFHGDTSQKFSFELTMEGGPKLEIGAKCELEINLRIGFDYETASGVTDLGSASVPKLGCSPVLSATLGTSSESVATRVKATVGLPMESKFSLRAGGVVTGAISRFVSWFAEVPDIGKVDAVVGTFGPTMTATWENGSMVANAEQAATGITGGLKTEFALVSPKPLHWVLGKFGLAGREFKLVLYENTLPVFDLLQPLNYSRAEATGGRGGALGLELTPSIYVHRNDRFRLRAVLKGSASGVGGATLPLDRAEVYQVGSAGVPVLSNLFDVSIAASTGAEAAYGDTTIVVEAEITEALCDQLHEPYAFKLVGYSEFTVGPAGFDVPAWGGRFTVHCVEGTVGWADRSIDEMSFGQARNSNVTTTGARETRWVISGNPVEYGDVWLPGQAGWLNGIPQWLTVTGPNGQTAGTVPGTPDHPAQETTVPFTFRITDTSSVLGCYEPREQDLYFVTESRGQSKIHLVERDPCTLDVVEESVTGPGIERLTLSTRGLQADQLTVTSPEDWVTVVSAPSSVNSSIEDETYEIQIRVQLRPRTCTLQLPRSLELTVSAGTRGSDTVQVIDPKVDPWPDCGARFDPDYAEISNGGSGSTTLRFRGDVPEGGIADWTISGGPAWLTVTPLGGTLAATGTAGVGFSAMPIDPDCRNTIPSRTGTFTATVTWEAPSEDDPGTTVERSATATMTVKRMPIPPSGDCPPPPPTQDGGAHGDPHMISMDGVRWEGQTLGEYIYLRSPLPAGDDAWEIVARHEPTGGGTTPRSPTSVYGAAVSFRDHRVEVLGGGPGPTVYVDGDMTELDTGVPMQVTDGLAVVRTGNDVRVDLPQASVVLRWYGIMDITVSGVVGMPMEGLLGSADDNPSNDFRGADGATYTATQIHDGLAAYDDFVSSWRVTDPDESRFTVPSAHFASPNPGFDPEVAALEDDAMAALTGYDRVCGGTLSERQLYGLALELHVGTPPARLPEYVCRYAVEGYALTEGSPTAGLRVRVDADGLTPCETTTGPDGRYRCDLLVDLTEVAAWEPDATFALTADVTGTWPGQAGSPIAASATASFAGLASLGAGPRAATRDLSIDPDSVPRLELSGVVRRDGAPLPGWYTIAATAYDASGKQLLSALIPTEVVAGGRFDVLRVFPPTAVRADLSMTVPGIGSAPHETFTSNVVNLAPGLNLRSFDVEFDVPRVRVHGTLSDGTAPIGGTHLVGLTARDAAGSVVATPSQWAVADPSTGTYDVTFELPRQARSATATVRLAPNGEVFTSGAAPIPVPGTAEIALDVVNPRPYVTVTGTLADAAGGPLGPSTLQVSFYDGATWLGQTFAQVSGNTYSVPVTAPAAADGVRAQISAGAVSETFATGVVPVVIGPNTITLDVAVTPVRLTVTGFLNDAVGAPLTGSYPVGVVFRGADGAVLTAGPVQYVTGDPATGEYSVTFVGHRDAVQADVTVTVAGNPYTVPAAGLHRGDNAVTRDVGYNPPVLELRGRATGPGGAPLVAPPNQMYIAISGYDDHFVGQSFNRYVTLDAEGDYAVDIVLPLSIVAVEARIGQISPSLPGVDHYFLERQPVASGRNPVTFDAAYDPPVVTVTGHMVSAPGVGLKPPYVNLPLDLGISGYRIDGSGQREQVFYTQPKITPAADGFYSTTVTLSRHATEVETLAYLGPQPRQTFTGIQPGNGSANTLPFDVQYWPAMVHLHGSAQVDGVVASSVYVQVHRGSTPIYGLTVPTTVGTGAFARDLVLPLGQTGDDLVVTVTPTAGMAHQLPLTDVDDGDSFDLDFGAISDTSTRLHLSGTAKMFGEPAFDLFVLVYPQLADGTPVGGSVPLYTDVDQADGSYELDVKLPMPTERVLVMAYPYEAGYQLEFRLDAPVTPQQGNQLELSTDSALVSFSGTVTRAGGRAESPNSELHFVVVHGQAEARHSYAQDVDYEPEDNSYWLNQAVPIDPSIGVAKDVQLELRHAGGNDFEPPPTWYLGDLEPGRYGQEWDVELAPTRPVRVSGHVHLDDAGEATEVVVTAFRYDPDNWGQGLELLGTDAWVDSEHSGSDVEFDLDHTFAMHAEANLIRVTIDGRWTRTFDLPSLPADGPGDPAEVIWNLDTTAGAELHVDGDVEAYPCSSPLPQVFAREYWVFTSAEDAAVGLDDYPERDASGMPIGNWGNGVLADRNLIVPDTVASGSGSDDQGAYSTYAYTSQVVLPATGRPVWVRIVNDVRGSNYAAFYGASELVPGEDQWWGGWNVDQHAACDG